MVNIISRYIRVRYLLLLGSFYFKMAKRKPISKTVRFEVFKRDSFTCQYCGIKAPNVILGVDHIITSLRGDKFNNYSQLRNYLVSEIKEINPAYK